MKTNKIVIKFIDPLTFQIEYHCAEDNCRPTQFAKSFLDALDKIKKDYNNGDLV